MALIWVQAVSVTTNLGDWGSEVQILSLRPVFSSSYEEFALVTSPLGFRWGSKQRELPARLRQTLISRHGIQLH